MKKEATLKINGELGPDSPELAPQALKVTASLPELVVSSGMNCDYVIDEALARLGSLLDASRAYVMLDEKDGKYLRNTHEWVTSSIGPAMFSWPLYDYEYDIPSLKDIMNDNDIFYGPVSDMPQDLNNILNKQGVISWIVAPIIRDRSRTGLVGLDFCEDECEFTRQHLEILKYFACMVGIALERKQYQAIRGKVNIIRDCIQSLEPYIEVSELDDDEADSLPSSRPARPTTLQDEVRRIIIETLELYNGNKLKTAKHLGLTWPSLDRRCKKLGIETRRK